MDKSDFMHFVNSVRWHFDEDHFDEDNFDEDYETQ